MEGDVTKQVVPPSPGKLAPGGASDSSPQSAAGDQNPFCAECGAYLNEAGFAVPWVDAETHATIARLERDKAALHKGNISLNLDIERLRAENARCRGNDLAGDPSKWPHTAQIEGLGMQIDAMRPVVEAAVEWNDVRAVITGKAPNDALYDLNEAPLAAMDALTAAVAAYEAAQVVPPSPTVNMGPERNLPGPAAGDQRVTYKPTDGYTVRLEDALARKNAALNASADALDAIAKELPYGSATLHVRAFSALARDAARTAAQEGAERPERGERSPMGTTP